jgi:hypothetical protein
MGIPPFQRTFRSKIFALIIQQKASNSNQKAVNFFWIAIFAAIVYNGGHDKKGEFPSCMKPSPYSPV